MIHANLQAHNFYIKIPIGNKPFLLRLNKPRIIAIVLLEKKHLWKKIGTKVIYYYNALTIVIQLQ